LTATQLGQIALYSDSGTANLPNDMYGVLDPVPEPATWFTGALALGSIGFSQRRRLRKFLAK
jgi:hypothetical protein